MKSVEVVKIESDGNIKVGPGADSRYTNYSADGVRFQATSGGAGWASGYSYHSHDYSKHLGTSVGAYGGGDTLNWFFYGGSAYNNAAMYILPNKRVGIGTSSPQSPCHIQSSEQVGLRVNCTPSNGAALLLDNNGKGASIGINQYGLWMQNCAGTGQPYIQLLNDGGFVIQKSSGRYDILHDGNLYDYVPRVIYSAAGLIGNSAGFSPFGNTLTASLINVTFSKPSTNVVRITLGSALYAAKRLRCTVFPTAIFGGTFSPAHLGRTYGVSYLNVNGAGLDDCNGIVKYIDIYCCYNGAITSPAGFVQISIELLPPIL